MNTKTMRLPPRRVLTPTASASASVPTNNNNNNKRKERDEGFDRLKPSPTVTATATTKFLKPDKPRTGFEPPATTATRTKGLEQPPPSANNQLLAGYLAHEFLTKGTLFGQVWDPSPAAEGPITCSTEKRRAAKPRQKGEAEPEKVQRYVEVASLLKMDGAHVRNVVNPTELAQLLQL